MKKIFALILAVILLTALDAFFRKTEGDSVTGRYACHAEPVYEPGSDAGSDASRLSGTSADLISGLPEAREIVAECIQHTATAQQGRM